MNPTAEIARAARAALKQAFPGSKISVTSTCGVWVRWIDDGPTVEQVQDVLLAAGCAEARKSWNGERYLDPPTPTVSSSASAQFVSPGSIRG
jgi:hypothetical protein